MLTKVVTKVVVTISQSYAHGTYGIHTCAIKLDQKIRFDHKCTVKNVQTIFPTLPRSFHWPFLSFHRTRPKWSKCPDGWRRWKNNQLNLNKFLSMCVCKWCSNLLNFSSVGQSSFLNWSTLKSERTEIKKGNQFVVETRSFVHLPLVPVHGDN